MVENLEIFPQEGRSKHGAREQERKGRASVDHLYALSMPISVTQLSPLHIWDHGRSSLFPDVKSHPVLSGSLEVH